jgi:DNA-binding transcriptional regulator YdaS (Cro superfamily)
MTLQEYVKTFPYLQRKAVREWIASQLGISEVYVRGMCNGRKQIPGKHALKIEKITDHIVPRYETAPQLYPQSEYSSIRKDERGNNS